MPTRREPRKWWLVSARKTPVSRLIPVTATVLYNTESSISLGAGSIDGCIIGQ